MPKLGIHYLYFLIDPRNNKIFYVGKGTDYRINEHTNLVKKDKVPNGNPKLFNKIKSILNDNLDVIKVKRFEGMNETFLLRKEIRTIKLIGLENLCNRLPGGEGFTSDTMKMLWEDENFRSKMMNKDYSWSKNNSVVKSQLDEARKLINYKESGKKISITRKRLGLDFSKENRMKGSLAPKLSRRRHVVCENIITKEKTNFVGIVVMSKEIGIKRGSIQAVLSGKRNSVFNHKFYYA
jgi:hypothetical protein